MTGKLTRAERDMMRAERERRVQMLMKASAAWALIDPEQAAHRAKEVRDLAKNPSLMDVGRQLQHYRLIAAAHGAEEEAEFQRLSKKGRRGGLKSGKVRTAKAEEHNKK
jgi:hypothetical protein